MKPVPEHSQGIYDAKAPETVPGHRRRGALQPDDQDAAQGGESKREDEYRCSVHLLRTLDSILSRRSRDGFEGRGGNYWAQLDTWHPGTGATNSDTGTAACMEAMRILQKLSHEYGIKAHRTIRMGLWGAEEQG